MKKLLYIVGEKFSVFAETYNTMTITQFKEAIVNHRVAEDVLCVFGQGVSAGEGYALQDLVREHRASWNVTFGNLDTLSYKEDKAIVHKHQEQNGMISRPVPRGPASYESILLLDNGCAEMSDHTTGQHVQGMVLVEAARQMMLAVTERYLLPDHLQEQCYFVLNGMSINYSQFVFPLDVRIHCNIEELKQRSSKVSGKMKFAFIQSELEVTSATIEFGAYAAVALSQQENKLAQRYFARQIASDCSIYQASSEQIELCEPCKKSIKAVA